VDGSIVHVDAGGVEALSGGFAPHGAAGKPSAVADG